MPSYTAFSCDDEYNYCIQAEADAEAYAREAQAEAEEIIRAMQFLVMSRIKK